MNQQSNRLGEARRFISSHRPLHEAENVASDEKLLDPNLASAIEITDDEVAKYMANIDNLFVESTVGDLLANCKLKTLEAIVTPLGLGKIISKFDIDGGNVDTIHNVRKSVWATKEEEKKAASVKSSIDKNGKKEAAKDPYNSSKIHSHSSYKSKNKEYKEQKEQGELTDIYTGKKIEDQHDLDHKVSAKEIHEDAGRVLAECSTEELANNPANLGATTPKTNRSKGSKPLVENEYNSGKSFKEHIEYKKVTIRKQLSRLEEKSKTSPLNENQQREKERLENALKTYEEIDFDLIEQEDKKARHAIDSKINKKYYTSKKFIYNAVKTSGYEGLKMGAQQAFGLLCYDLFNALFDEVMDIWKNGLVDSESSNWQDAVKIRLKRVGHIVVSDWQNLVISFRDGVFSGIFSNLLTVAVNTFWTTWKKIVRMIREGTMVLYNTIKSVLTADKNKSWQEILDDAVKLLVAGTITVGGIALDELISAALGAFPGKDILVGIAIGIITGISTVLALYALDKLDPFGIKDTKRRELFYKKIRQDEKELILFQKSLYAY